MIAERLWWMKICAKIILSRLPIDYSFWKKINLFRHGHMDQADYIAKVFDKHIHRSGLVDRLQDKVILELGPGDSVGSTLLAYAFGARSVLIDAGPFAVRNVEFYQKLADSFRLMGLRQPEIRDAVTLDDVLSAAGARYLTEGLNSFAQIETGSVDFIYSQAVLEHVRRHEFITTMQECRRVLSAHGVVSHRIDLKDHLGGSLNNLRFKDSLWESDFLVKSGFYTNRIRFSEMCKNFKESNFDVDVIQVDRWEKLPIARHKIDPSFSLCSDQDLCVKGFDVLLRPVGDSI